MRENIYQTENSERIQRTAPSVYKYLGIFMMLGVDGRFNMDTVQSFLLRNFGSPKPLKSARGGFKGEGKLGQLSP